MIDINLASVAYIVLAITVGVAGLELTLLAYLSRRLLGRPQWRLALGVYLAAGYSLLLIADRIFNGPNSLAPFLLLMSVAGIVLFLIPAIRPLRPGAGWRSALILVGMAAVAWLTLSASFHTPLFSVGGDSENVGFVAITALPTLALSVYAAIVGLRTGLGPQRRAVFLALIATAVFAVALGMSETIGAGVGFELGAFVAVIGGVLCPLVVFGWGARTAEEIPRLSPP